MFCFPGGGQYFPAGQRKGSRTPIGTPKLTPESLRACALEVGVQYSVKYVWLLARPVQLSGIDTRSHDIEWEHTSESLEAANLVPKLLILYDYRLRFIYIA